MGDILGTGAAVSFGIPRVLINICLTFALTLIISWVYKRTHRGLSYSQSFVFTLVIMSFVVTLVMMVIGNSIALAFGLLGAFSIIRFRTPVKDARDTAFIFFALGIGMAVGTNNYSIAIIGTALGLLMIFLMTWRNFGSINKYEYLLSFTMAHDEGNQGVVDGTFKKYLKNSLLLNINAKRDGAASEMTYQVDFTEEEKRNDFVKELSGLAGIEKVHLITSKDDVEY